MKVTRAGIDQSTQTEWILHLFNEISENDFLKVKKKRVMHVGNILIQMCSITIYIYM